MHGMNSNLFFRYFAFRPGKICIVLSFYSYQYTSAFFYSIVRLSESHAFWITVLINLSLASCCASSFLTFSVLFAGTQALLAL